MELLAQTAVNTIDSSISSDGIAFDSLSQVVYFISSGARLCVFVYQSYHTDFIREAGRLQASC